MSPGPAKQFDPDLALEQARDLFWERGYDGTSLSALEAAMGIGRKSFYDTFGSKRELYLRSLRHYTDTVIAKIRAGLDDPRNGPLENLERVLGRLQAHHGSPDSLGCLLGVAMGQAGSDDDDLAALVRDALHRLELAFRRNLEAAQADGTVDADASPRDAARALVALTQGMALLGRVAHPMAQQRSIVRAALHGLRP